MHHAHDKFLKIRIVQVYLLYDVCEETEAISSGFLVRRFTSDFVLSTMIMRNKRAVAEEQGEWSSAGLFLIGRSKTAEGSRDNDPFSNVYQIFQIAK